jgi:Ca-activated chloride channel family protein
MRSFLNRQLKWAVFGVVGLVGGLLFALLGEPAASLSAPVSEKSSSKAQVDLVFVLDVTGSMQKEIDGVRASINEFVRESEVSGVPIRFALVTFRDLTYNQSTELVQGFTSDPKAFTASMSGLSASGGGENLGESSLDGLKVASGLPFMPFARKVIVLITDETWHEPDGQVLSASELISALKQTSVEAVHVVASSRIIGDFSFLTKVAPGKRFKLDASGRTESSLSRLFQGVAREVISPSMLGRASTEARMDYSFSSYLKGVASVGLWLSLVAIGIGLLLVAAQRYMLGGSLRASGLLKAAALGTLIGIVSGVCAQTAYFSLSSLGLPDPVGRIFSWMLVGAGLGLAMTFVIPNVPRPRTLLCGAAGGFMGAIAFMVIVAVMSFSDFGGRLVGAMILGFSVGIAVAMAEIMAREAFLVVHWAKNETSTVNIGKSAVEIGTTNESTVRLSTKTGYPARVASFKLVDGKATLINHMSKTTHVLKDGNKLTLGTVVIEVRIVH